MIAHVRPIAVGLLMSVFAIGCGKKEGDTPVASGSGEKKNARTSDKIPIMVVAKKTTEPKTAQAPPSIPKGWQEHVSEKGKFRVLVPTNITGNGSPERESPDGGEFSVLEHFEESMHVRYMVSYFDTPDARKFLENVLNDSKEAIKARRDVQLGQHKGTEVVTEVKEKIGDFEWQARITSRLFLVGNRVYSVGTVQKGLKPAKEPENCKKFLDSFELREGGGS